MKKRTVRKPTKSSPTSSTPSRGGPKSPLRQVVGTQAPRITKQHTTENAGAGSKRVGKPARRSQGVYRDYLDRAGF